MNIYGVILAGGQSSRLFPFNKILSDFCGSGRTLLQQAFDRLVAEGAGTELPLLPQDRVYVLTLEEFIRPMRKQLPLRAGHFLNDPVRRGTWPALLWAMAQIRHKEPDALLAVVTGDHVIPDVDAFRRSLRQAIQLAQARPSVVLVGVQPTRNPADWRGFGAVQTRGEAIIGFEEKPTLERAAEMIEEGGWFWNAGMFFYRISSAEAALRRYQPAMAAVYDSIAAAVQKRDHVLAERLFGEFQSKIPHPLNPDRQVDNTIDYALMTPLVHAPGDVAALAADQPLLRWTDLGQWVALREVVSPDARNNIRIGDALADDQTSDCILAADPGYHLAARGVQGIIAAFSNQTLLLLPEREVAQVKELVQTARERADASVFEQNCQDCHFQAKHGRIVASGLNGVRARLSGRKVVLTGPGIIG